MPEPQTLTIRHERVSWVPTDDTVVILDLQDSRYLSLNTSGSFLWKLLVVGTTAERLQQSLRDEFGLERDRAESDVSAFLDALRRRDLLTAT